jgi:hypothetical protein
MAGSNGAARASKRFAHSRRPPPATGTALKSEHFRFYGRESAFIGGHIVFSSLPAQAALEKQFLERNLSKKPASFGLVSSICLS